MSLTVGRKSHRGQAFRRPTYQKYIRRSMLPFTSNTTTVVSRTDGRQAQLVQYCPIGTRSTMLSRLRKEVDGGHYESYCSCDTHSNSKRGRLGLSLPRLAISTVELVKTREDFHAPHHSHRPNTPSSKSTDCSVLFCTSFSIGQILRTTLSLFLREHGTRRPKHAVY